MKHWLTYLLLTAVCVPLTAATSTDFAKVIESISSDIQRAQQSLSASEARIAREAKGIYQTLNKKQQRVAKLRDQLIIAKRMADEQSLGLDQLQTRLKTWQDQTRYQRYLFTDFAEKMANSASNNIDLSGDTSTGITAIKQALKTVQSRLNPSWTPSRVVLPDGLVENAMIMQLGPVAWFWQPEQSNGGLVNGSKDGLFTVSQLFDIEQQQQLALLYSKQKGQVYFDPTLKHVLQLANSNESLLQHMQKGGVWVIPIIVFAMLSIAIAILKTFQLWRLPKQDPLLSQRIESIIQKKTDVNAQLKRLQQTLRGTQADLVTITMDTPVSQQRDERLFACLLENRHRLEQLLGAIAITAAVSPLLGLLGTVSGMIETFKLMTIFGAGDPAAVSGGISEALVTTEMGLVVAIPSLLLHALLSRSIRNHNTPLETTAIKLGQLHLSGPTP